MSYNYLFKLIVVGKCGAGKTSLVDSWRGRYFNPEFNPTIGVEFAAKNVIINNKQIKIHLWDTAGQEKFASIISTYYRGCAGAFIVFDVSNRSGFNNLNYWIQEIKNNNNNKQGIPMIIIGTKIDKKDRKVSFEEAEEFAEINGCQYIETSSKNLINVEDAFELLVKQVYLTIDTNDTLPQGIKKGALKSKYDDEKNRYCDEDAWSSCCCVS
jgi:Ras-related protein Rab-2A